MDRQDVLELAASSPIVEFSDGDLVIRQDQPTPALFVLTSGSLAVSVGGSRIALISEPGSVVGEIGLLLGSPATADVTAIGSTTVHRLDDAAELFDRHPGFGRFLAVGLARRLRQITTYLADLNEQFADRPGTLGLVPVVLEGLISGHHDDVESGSDRESESPY
jgi:CRP-like cAMP-binding protein